VFKNLNETLRQERQALWKAYNERRQATWKKAGEEYQSKKEALKGSYKPHGKITLAGSMRN